jgi:hypothetical protein
LNVDIERSTLMAMRGIARLVIATMLLTQASAAAQTEHDRSSNPAHASALVMEEVAVHGESAQATLLYELGATGLVVGAVLTVIGGFRIVEDGLSCFLATPSCMPADPALGHALFGSGIALDVVGLALLITAIVLDVDAGARGGRLLRGEVTLEAGGLALAF